MSFTSFFKDKNGKVAMWQTPNPPLILWFVSMLVSRVVSHGHLHNLLTAVAFGMLFTWAWLEIISGTSYFRRTLGIVVLIAVVVSKSQ